MRNNQGTEPHPYSTAMLHALGTERIRPYVIGLRKGYRGRVYAVPMARHVYGGTVPEETVQKRRAANRVARKSRRINRLRKG